MKLGTLIGLVLDTMSQPIDFGFKGLRVRARESAPIASPESAQCIIVNLSVLPALLVLSRSSFSEGTIARCMKN